VLNHHTSRLAGRAILPARRQSRFIALSFLGGGCRAVTSITIEVIESPRKENRPTAVTGQDDFGAPDQLLALRYRDRAARKTLRLIHRATAVAASV
jgi:hypothetical protein